tara:strand:- start:189 stop:323 length:135 start_codon:yes stop_codon:yes gene_type:complete
LFYSYLTFSVDAKVNLSEKWFEKNVKIKLFSTLAFTIKGCVLGN